MSVLGKRLAKALKKTKLARKIERKLKGASKSLNKRADRIFERWGMRKDGLARNLVRRAICTVTGHPVDVATGKVFTDFVDLELPGPLAFKLERVWFSTSTYEGPLGHGWHASFDMALALQAMENKQFGYRPSMRAYKVTQDTPAAIALAKANVQHGPGGFPQLFIENYESVLEPIEVIPLPP